MARKTDGELISNYLLVKGYKELESGLLGGAKYRCFRNPMLDRLRYVANSGQIRVGFDLESSLRMQADIAKQILTDAKLYFKPVEAV